MRFRQRCLRVAAGVLATLTLFSSRAGSGDYPPRRGQKQTVSFPGLGEVVVEGRVPAHRLPEITFSSAASGKLLLEIELGAGMLDPKYIDPGKETADPYPIVRFKAISLPELPSPIVFSAVMHAGGSDCSYMGALAGEVDGKTAVLSPSLPVVNAEGGYAIGNLEKSRGLELAAWNMIWRDGEAHMDPHDQWVRIYEFDTSTGRFVFARRYVRKKTEPEISFPNLLRQIPDFGC